MHDAGDNLEWRILTLAPVRRDETDYIDTSSMEAIVICVLASLGVVLCALMLVLCERTEARQRRAWTGRFDIQRSPRRRGSDGKSLQGISAAGGRSLGSCQSDAAPRETTPEHKTLTVNNTGPRR